MNTSLRLSLKNAAIFASLATLPAISGFAVDWSGGGADNDWTTDGVGGNWGGLAAPVSGEQSQVQNNANHVVDITTDLTNSGTEDFNLSWRSGTFNIESTGKVASSVGTNLETGDTNGTDLDANSVTQINVKGELDIKHSMRLARYGNTRIDVTDNGILKGSGASGGGRVFGFDTYDASINVSGNGQVITSGVQVSAFNSADSAFNLSENATINLSASDYIMSTANSVKHTFSVTGSNVTATLGDVDAFATDLGDAAIFKFIADASGISTIGLSALTLDGGDHAADVIVDTTLLTGGNQTLELFDYATISGSTFADVQLIGGNFTIGAINYTGGDGTSITLDLVAIPIPEPSAYALFAGLLGLTSVIVRRRK
jgi:hypothetical protein